jgi:hypothetical protein
MDGFAIDTTGMSNDSSNLSSRRDGGAVAEGGEVMAARAESAREGVEVGKAAERWGSSNALRSGKYNFIE